MIRPAQFERNFQLLFDNARLYNTEESQVYQDANVLEQIFASQPTPTSPNRKSAPPPPPLPSSRASAAKSSSSSGRDAAAGAAAGSSEVLSNSEMMRRAWVAIRGAKDGKRERAALFMELPSRQVSGELRSRLSAPHWTAARLRCLDSGGGGASLVRARGRNTRTTTS